MTVLEDVETFLGGFDAGPLAAIARALAVRLDDTEESSPAQVAKELRATLAAITETPARKADPVDEISARRTARRAGAAS